MNTSQTFSESKLETLISKGVTIKTGRFPVQTLLDVRPSLGTQPHYKTPSKLRVELVQNAVIDIRLVRLSPREWPKVGRGTAKYQLKQKNMGYFN